MRLKRLAIAALVLGQALLFAAGGGSRWDRQRSRALESITQEELRQGVEFLSSERLRGRDAGTEGNRLTVEYLLDEFLDMGLETGGVEGFLQPFPLVRSTLLEGNRLILHSLHTEGGGSLELHEGFYPAPHSANGEASASVVFAGYGITAPEHGYDDYRGVEAAGRIALILMGEPRNEDPDSRFEGAFDSRYAREFHKILNAQRHGAAAAILIEDSGNLSLASRFSWPEDTSIQRYLLEFELRRIEIPAVYVAKNAVHKLLRTLGVDLERFEQKVDGNLEPRSRVLAGLRATLGVAAERTSFEVNNVLAKLPGRDERLRDEVVILGAHFDHVGARNGSVFHGADDNASGIMGLLEVAEALAQGRRAPRRTVLFAAWNAEEKGLLGSRYYARHPVAPLEDTVAMFQLDMIGRDEEIPESDDERFFGLDEQEAGQNSNAVNVLGYSRSEDLRKLVVRNNRRVLLKVRFRYDGNPVNLLRRSDHWSFLERGVPSLLFTTGLHPDYHRPTDTADKLNYRKMKSIARLVYLCVWEAAEETPRPALERPDASRSN